MMIMEENSTVNCIQGLHNPKSQTKHQFKILMQLTQSDSTAPPATSLLTHCKSTTFMWKVYKFVISFYIA